MQQGPIQQQLQQQAQPAAEIVTTNMGLTIQQLQAHTAATQQLLQQQPASPTMNQEIKLMLANLKVQVDLQKQAILQMGRAMEKLDGRIKTWEITYLASVMDKLEDIKPTSATPFPTPHTNPSTPRFEQ